MRPSASAATPTTTSWAATRRPWRRCSRTLPASPPELTCSMSAQEPALSPPSSWRAEPPIGRRRPSGRSAEASRAGYRTAPELHELLAPHGEVEAADLDVTAGYVDFDEFWRAMDRGVGPAGQWLASLDSEQRQRAYDELSRQLGSPQGPFELKARAFAAALTPA